MRISSAAQCRLLDAEAIALGMPGIALMELASKAVADAVCWLDTSGGVKVLCGGGNNGGDGYGAARWLRLRGVDVRTHSLSERSTGDALVMRDAARAHGVTEDATFDAGLVVDAVFGTGLTRSVEGRHRRVLESAAGATVVAVDIPSGLHADTGAVLGTVLTADHTVTFGRMKPAFFSRGGVHAGTVECIDIGVHPTQHTLATVLGSEDLPVLRRPAFAHKNHLGHVAIVAGSAEYAGAAVLACLGALALSPGLVTLFTPPEALSRLATLPPEVIVRPLSWDLSGFDAVAVGPGLSPDPEALRELVAGDQPIVVDAGALLPGLVWGPNTLCTPHPGEAARMLACTTAEIEADRFGASQRLPATSVLKGAHSLIRGSSLRVSPFRTPVLATAGSGDVLTGMIGALLARGLTTFEAASLGVWLHGRAGESLQAQRSEGWRASDIAAAVPACF